MSATKKNILFVDDDDELRQITKEVLTMAGYDVDEADDGLVAMEKLRTGSYDVVLLDINMPGKSGLDILQYTKERSLTCRVIMLTGVAGRSFTATSAKLGADDYLTKPFTMEHLLSSIKRSLTT